MNESQMLRDDARRTRLQVAIDGPAGAGKTTIGDALAARLDVPLVDTGLMYRAITRAAQEQGADPSDAESILGIAETITFSQVLTGHTCALRAGDQILVETALHTPAIDRDVSTIAAHQQVRAVLVDTQRRLAAQKAIVMLGRDIGTIVLPDADIKLFVTATPETRAARRASQHLPETSKHEPEVSQSLALRDAKDSTRAVSPMRVADDAVVIDTSGQAELQSIESAWSVVRQALSRKLERAC